MALEPPKKARMMAPPVDKLPDGIDPWSFAQQRRQFSGHLATESLRELVAWCPNAQGLAVSLAGYCDAHHQAHLRGSVAVDLEMPCQRCLQPMTVPIDQRFDYVLIKTPTAEDHIQGGFEALLCEDETLDIAWFFEEEALLALPMIARHFDCKTPDGGRVDNPEQNRQYPFAVLKDLMKFKEH